MNVGFIGTGIMGSRMAANLLSAGYHLCVHNRTPSKADPLIENGATWAATPADAAINADIVVTMLAHPTAVEAAALHPENGLLSTMSTGALWVDCSTVNPTFARRMAAAATEKGVHFLDAPVAGSKNQAQDAQLVFFVGGAAQDISTAQPLFDVMGKAVNHVGEHGMGNALKLVVNHLLATSMLAFAEGMALGEALGISQETLLNTLIGGVVAPPYLAGKRANIETGTFATEFPLRWIQKDLHMVAETAYQTSTPMPSANAAKEIYQLATTHGFGDRDFSAIYAFIKNIAQ